LILLDLFGSALRYFLWPALLGLGLDPGYYAHLVTGQARLLLNRKPISKLLEDPNLAPDLRERLSFIQEVRQFAVSRIGLTQSRNYSSYCDTGEGPLSWQLTVAPQDRLKPVYFGYPVVGRFPYKGFFSLDRARKERDRWKERGYDTFLRPVSAYSTLGWFDDPVVTSMLGYRDDALADLIIHELTHATVWVDGDVGFNESLATFVGQSGSISFLEDRHGPESAEVSLALSLRSDGRVFRRFMAGVAQELSGLYDLSIDTKEKLTRREAIFDSARVRFSRLELKTRAYSGFSRWELNNARLLAYRTYHEGIDLFDRVCEEMGLDLRRAVEVFRTCEGRRNPARYLEEWLQSRRPTEDDTAK
jgi:predicted aminopeptidase